MKIIKLTIIVTMLATVVNATDIDPKCMQSIIEASQASHYSTATFNKGDMKKFRAHKKELKIAMENLVTNCNSNPDPEVQDVVKDAERYLSM